MNWKRAGQGALLGVSISLAALGAQAQSIDLSIGFQAFGNSASQLSGDTIIPNVPVFSDDSRQALDAYNRGDFATAGEIWGKLAEDGDIVAQWYLGRMYRLGQGVRADNAMALKYYEQVGRHFDADRSQRDRFGITRDALFWVAYYYRSGDETSGIQQRPNYAFRLFRVTANHGHAGGQFLLGTMFLKGDGVTRNRKVGMRWLNLAAEKHYAAAMAQLGEIYWQGELAEADRARGLMWYILASEHGREELHPEIYDRYEDLYTIASDDERRMAEGLALQWNQQNPKR